jgi:hypothetical protein
MINSEKYSAMLNNEGFLNDCWNQFDATTKIGLLERGGLDMEKEWDEWYEEFMSKEADMREALGVEDENAEIRTEEDLNEETHV